MKRNEVTQNTIFLKHYGPWAVIAGASQGLGAAYATALAERGLNLVLIARNAEKLDQLASSLTGQFGIEVQSLVIDLSDPWAIDRITVETSRLQVGLLVYNAAFSTQGPFLSHTLAEHMKELDTNIRAPLGLIHHFGCGMLEQGHGGIILMTSLSAFQGSAYISNYSATKAFNLVLAEGLWEEWRKQGVDVLACIAGAVETPNYLASAPKKTNRFSDGTMPPQAVVAEALAALGRVPTIVPGRMNRFSSFIMRRILPRRAAIGLMGSVLRGMYAPDLSNGKGEK
jgi:uncharacterized protein